MKSIDFGFTSKDKYGDSLIVESNIDVYGQLTEEAKELDTPFCVTVGNVERDKLDYNVTELTLEQAEELVKELTKAINFLKE